MKRSFLAPLNAIGLLLLGFPVGSFALRNLPAVQPAPSISSFTASPATVSAGARTTLTAVFLNGSGLITPGKIPIASGVALHLTPSASTHYTLTVTSPLGRTATSTASVLVTAALAPPLIAAFSASPATITAGQTAALTATFANGTAVLTPGNLAITSNTPISVSPTATTTYTLTVTNGAGAAITASATVTVNQPVASEPALGVNIGWVNDWDPTQLFADAVKQSRKFGSVAAPWDETASVDALGWPTQDAGLAILINNQGGWSAGPYALAFTGQAAVKAWGDANVTVGPVAYNAATNVSAATVTVGPAYKSVYLVFSGTRRTPASPSGSGITNISLMRPSLNGTPHAAGTLFTDRFLDRLKYFTALRMMDYLQVNGSTEAAWTDRAIPADASQQETPGHTSQDVNAASVTGASYEYAVQLANQSGKDLWLNIPHLAFGGTYAFPTTAWATNLALLLKYGSDAAGVPYTGPAGSAGTHPQPAAGPVNPALNPGLHVYIEYSNEFWSGVGTQSTWIAQQAAAAIAGSDPDLDYDHDKNVYDLESRINAKGVLLIANAFAAVYGSSSFGTVYRPIFAGQIGNSGTFAGLAYLDAQHSGARQFVWAIAAAPYVDFAGDTPENPLTSAQVLSGMQAYQTADLTPWIASLASLATEEKLDGGMVAYEGGQGALYATTAAVAAQTEAPMRTVTTGVVDAWFAHGGGPFFYYKLCSADQWGLATDISYDIDADPHYTPSAATSTEAQPKWGAIKQIATLGK